MAASLRRSVRMGTKEVESSTGRVWAAGLRHVTARSRLARGFERMKLLLYVFNFPIFFFFFGRSQPWIRRFTCIAEQEALYSLELKNVYCKAGCKRLCHDFL